MYTNHHYHHHNQHHKINTVYILTSRRRQDGTGRLRRRALLGRGVLPREVAKTDQLACSYSMPPAKTTYPNDPKGRCCWFIWWSILGCEGGGCQFSFPEFMVVFLSYPGEEAKQDPIRKQKGAQ